MNYLGNGVIHRNITVVHVVDWHTRVELWSWLGDELRLHRIWVIVLDNTIKWLGTNGSELLSWGPSWTLRLGEERCILGPDIEAFRVVSTLLGWLRSLILACPVLG